MPYPRAYLWAGALLLLTVPAFWQTYFGALDTVEWQLHVHGTTAGLWLLLVICQSWSIHHGRRALHRAAGLSSLVLVPLFLAGGLLVVNTIAARPGPFSAMFGARLALFDLISAAAFAYFVFAALKQRRTVALHAGYMLATVFLLVNPIFGRLFPMFVPGLTIRTLEDLPRFAGSIHLAQAVAMAIALWLYSRDRRYGTPFLAVSGVLAAQSIVFETVSRTVWWADANRAIGTVAPVTMAAIGLIVGVIVVYFGWNAAGGPLGLHREPQT